MIRSDNANNYKIMAKTHEDAKRISSPPSETVTAHRMRPRAATIMSPPKAESNPRGYTAGRIQEGLDWACQRMASKTRKPTPNSEKIILEYIDALTEFQDDVKGVMTEKQKYDRLTIIKGMEGDINHCRWAEMSIGEESGKQSWAADIIELKKRQLYSRYGDYLSHVCFLVRGESQKRKVEGWASLQPTRNWANVSKDIKGEATQWEEHGSKYPTEVQTTYAVYQTCKTMGFDFDTVVEAIHGYAERNQLFHSGIMELAQGGNFAGVAKRLYDDIQGVDSYMSVKDSIPHKCITAILHQMKEQWFDVDDEEELGSWVAKPELRALRRKGDDDEEAKKERKKKAEAEVYRGVMRRMNEAEENRKLEQSLIAKKPALDPQPKKKRKAMEDLVRRTRADSWIYLHHRQGIASETHAESIRLMAESEQKKKESIKKRVVSYSQQMECNRVFSYLYEKHGDRYSDFETEGEEGDEAEVGHTAT